ncbi:MAG: DinB family protein [Chthonomonas sp.]|nr:DinB family protein [Chthonomonas sp.]
MSPYILNGPRLTLSALERILKLIPATRWDETLHEGRFTPREVIAHLADWEPIWLERLKGAVSVPNYVIEPKDEGEMAIANRYHEADVPGALTRFRSGREATLEFVGSLTDEQLQLPITHPHHGAWRVADIFMFLLVHDGYHIDQLSEYLEESAVGTW